MASSSRAPWRARATPPALWFALQWGAENRIAPALPATAPPGGPLDVAIVVLVVQPGSAQTLCQSPLAQQAETPQWHCACTSPMVSM